MSRWEPPTMQSIQKLEDNPLVQCLCGRIVNADMMRALNGGFACDACHDLLFKTGAVTAEEFALSQGAPAEVVERAQELDATLIDREVEVAARTAGTVTDSLSQGPV